MTTTEAQKIAIQNYLTKIIGNFLEYYYKTVVHADLKIQNTHEYFKLHGGKNWVEKYKSSRGYRILQESISSNIFQDELKLLTEFTFEKMIELKENFEQTYEWSIDEPFEVYTYKPYISYEELTQLYIDNVVNVNVDLK